MTENAEATEAAVNAVMASRHLRSEGSQRWARQVVVVALAAAAPLIAAEADAELRETCEQHYRRAERLRKDYIALTAEVITGLTTGEHEMTVVTNLPFCRCGYSLGGGDASGAFITHALAILNQDSP